LEFLPEVLVLRRSIFFSAAAIWLSSSVALADSVESTCPQEYNAVAPVSAAVAEALNVAPCGLVENEALQAKYRSGKRLSPAEFIQLVAPMAQRAEQETGVPASVTLAQAILESGFGKTAHRADNNLFGVKGHGNAGSVSLWTREYYGGRWHKVRDRFAAYKTLSDSVVAHGKLLSGSRIYTRAMKVADDPIAFAKMLQKCGYATDPHYASGLIALMKEYNLRRFDDTRSCPS
jgi:flagellum-specific peptidoglycan hydrolase FlgJ